MIAAVQRWLSVHGQWLLIWDNVEDLDLLQRFLPLTHAGAMLLTTRCQILGTFARGLELLPMEREEGVLFLLRRAKMLEPSTGSEHLKLPAERTPAQYVTAKDVVETLGGLPPALDQAGAYLEATRCGLPAYLERFRTQRAALLKLRGEGTRDHPDSVSTTFTLALRATAERHPAVLDLLQVCALLQPGAIPEELFCQAGAYLGATLAGVCGDPLEWDRVVGLACAYSLLTRQPEEHTLSQHRLVQAVLLDAMTAAEQEQWKKRVIEALDAMFPEVLPEAEYPVRMQCERLLPHALLCWSRASEESLAYASLAYKMAQYLRERAQYLRAKSLYQRARAVREQLLGPEHPLVAAVLSNLAVLCSCQGDYTEAEPLFQHALSIREQLLGPEHPLVATSLNNLANLYFEQSQYPKVEPLLLRALHISEQTLGVNHLEVARPLNNLANLYWSQGRYVEAEPLLLRVLHISEQALGLEHPLLAFSLNILAEIYTEQGRFRQAEALHQRALHIREQLLGPDHPTVAESLKGLANLYFEQGQYPKVEPLYQQALHIWEQALGLDHPYLVEPLTGLANLYREQGRDREAEAFYRRALSIREHHLGSQHPETAQTLHSLALFQQKQGNLSKALSLAEHALQIRVQSLGESHPKTMVTCTLYAQLVREQASAEVEAASRRRLEVIPDPRRNECSENGAASPLHQVVPLVPSEDDPLQEFLDACCERHPRAWCRIRDLWQTYKHWTQEQQERFPFSRRAFAAQLKARGCCVDRTSTARIWRDIAPTKKTMTKNDNM